MATNSIVSLFDQPLNAQPSPMDTGPAQAALPATIPFNYDGQLYHIPTAGYATEEEAIDAFLSEQNPPTDIEPTAEAPTDVQIGEQGIISNTAETMQPLAVEQPAAPPQRGAIDLGPMPAMQSHIVNNDGTPKIPDTKLGDLDEEDDFNVPVSESIDEFRRRFTAGALSVGADLPSAVALSDIERQRGRMQRADIGNVLTGGVGGRERAVAMQMQAVRGAKREEEDALVQRIRAAAPGVQDLLQHPGWKAGEVANAWIKENFPSRDEFDNTLLGKISGPLGQTVGFMVGAAGTPALSAILGGSVNQVQQFKDAIINGASFDDALKAGAHGELVGFTEALPIMSVLQRMDKGTGGVFTKYVSERLREKIGKAGEIGIEAIGGLVEEALQESFQNFMNNVDAKDIVGYDPDRDRWAGVKEGAEIGGAIGFVLSAFSSAFGMGKRGLQEGAQKRLIDEQMAIMAEQEAAAKTQRDAEAAAAAAEEAARTGQPEVGTRQPDITQAAPYTKQMPFSIEDTDTYAANDPNRDFQLARDAILQELPPDHGLTERQIDRLANLRADSRGMMAGGQQELDLGFQPAIERQGELDLQRDFEQPGQFPDSGTQQELPLPEIGGRTGEAQFAEPQGPQAELVGIDQGKVQADTAERQLEQRIARQEVDSLNADIAILEQFTTNDTATLGKKPKEELVRIARNAGIRHTGTKAELVLRIKTNAPSLIKEYTADRDSYAARVQQGTAAVIPFPQRAAEEAPAGATGVESVDRLARPRRERLAPVVEKALKTLGIRPLAGKSASETLDSLSEATRQKLRTHINDMLSAEAVDAAERTGYDFQEQQRNDVAMEELAQLLQDNITAKRERGDLPPLRSEPTAAEFDTAQMPLRLPEPRTSEPRQGPYGQPELPFGQEQGKPPTPGPIPNPYNEGLPPAPPPPSPPTAAPTGAGSQRTSLTAVARSRPIAGEETTVVPERKGVAVAGRIYPRVAPTRTGKLFNRLPSKVRKYVDMALTTSILPGRTDVKAIKEIIRAQAQNGRALADVTEHTINKVRNLYRASTGTAIEDASREDQRLFSQYLRGEVTEEQVLEGTAVKQEFVDALTEARDAIKEMSQVMLDNDMIPAEMRLSLEENLGAYISVSYAANVLNQDRTAAEILEMIPEDVRNRWIDSFITAYVNPIKAGIEALDEMSMSELRRMAKQFGITERLRKPSEEEGALGEVDIQVLKGTDTDYNRATKEELVNALAETDVSNYTQQSEEMTNLLLSAFHSTTTGRGTGRGRDKSIERRLDLARTREALENEGYSEAEILHMQSTRELLMEVLDPITNIGITMNKMMNTIVAHRIVNDIASLQSFGVVSLDGRDTEKGLTEPLIPRGSAMSDIRVPRGDGSGKLMFASVQEDAGRQSDGIYVTPSVARVFRHMMEPRSPSNAAMQIARAATGWTKISLTAMSPRSHPRNLDTAVLLLGLRGHMMTNPKVLFESFHNIFGVAMRELGTSSTATDLAKRGKQADLDVILEYFTSLGINNDSIRSGPGHELITKMLEDQNLSGLEGSTWVNEKWKSPEQALASLRTKAGTPIGRALAAVTEKPMTAFRLEDEAVKMLAFMVERRRYASMTGRTDLVDMMDGKVDMTPAQLDELRGFDREIAKYITDLYPTYSRVPAPIRAASRNIFVTPFPSFTAEMWRNSTNDMLDLGNLLAGTGRYKDVPAAKRNTLFATRMMTTGAYYVTISSMISSVSQMSLAGISAVGTDPTDEELQTAFEETLRKRDNPTGRWTPQNVDMALRVFAPAYLKNSLFQIVDYQPGETVTLRALGFTLPNSQQAEAQLGMMNVLNLLAEGNHERAFDRLISTTRFLVQDYVKPEVLAVTVYEAMQGVRQQGGRVWNDNDDFDTKAKKSIAHIAKIAVPGAGIYKEAGKFVEAAKDDSEMREMFEFLVGINDTKYRIDNLWINEFRSVAHANTSIGSSTSKINQLVRETEPMEKDEFIGEYLKLEGERRESFEDMTMLVKAGRGMGLSDRTMQKLVDSMPSVTNPGGHTIRDIERGRYRAYTPTLENALQSYVPEDRWKLSIDEAKKATRADSGMIRERLGWIREYRGKIRSGNYDR